MATNYVLIDFENVRPSNLEILKRHSFKVLVFVGESQAKIPYDLAAALQSLGDTGKYIKIAGSGKNALDFHIAYYVGELVAKDPNAYFHIISRDTGFDPLIKHLKSKNIKVQRENDLAEIPSVRMPTAIPVEDKIAVIVKNLAGRGSSKPRKVKTLSNTINSLFTEKLSEKEVSAIIQDMENRKYIKINDNKVTYKLPQ